jgi:hypothetical protein
MSLIIQPPSFYVPHHSAPLIYGPHLIAPSLYSSPYSPFLILNTLFSSYSPLPFITRVPPVNFLQFTLLAPTPFTSPLIAISSLCFYPLLIYRGRCGGTKATLNKIRERAHPFFLFHVFTVFTFFHYFRRRNYLLLQEIYENGHVARSTLQKKLKNIETLEMPWSEFLETITENHLCNKPSFSPEGSSKDEPKAELIPLNYTIRKLLGMRIETCRW